MTQVYKFFGFGAEFINMMDTIGTGRTANILFDDGSLSNEFDLETGRPQGDGISPLKYNMGEQIVLLKIELDPEIASVFQHMIVPRFILNLTPDPRKKGVDRDYNLHLAQESNRETNKQNAFADDNTACTLSRVSCVEKIRDVCSNFANFSGLRTNMAKTTLLLVGNADHHEDGLINVGFTVGQEFLLLGMVINRDLSALNSYFDEISVKVARLIEYWERFYLTLPGRIDVCKTFMLSLIGYLGCIITPSPEQILRLQTLMDNFCQGHLRIAKKKLYTPPHEGGLGLIKISDYITALQSSWIKRVTQHWGDNWRYDVMRATYGNPLIATKNTFSRDQNPLLFNICSSFGIFKKSFEMKGSNFKKAFIFKNPLFKRGRNSNELLCEGFFGRDLPFEEYKKIARLKYEDLFMRGGPKSLHSLNLDFNLNLNLVVYMRLHEALQLFAGRIRNEIAVAPQSLEMFLKSFNKGSKPFRKILQYEENKSLNISNLNSVTTFCALIGLEIPDSAILKCCWGEWKNRCLTNRCQEFVYKFRNNILGLNSRVRNFVPNVNGSCTLCTEGNEPAPVNSETFMHVFYECVYSCKYRNKLIEKFFPELSNAEEDVLKKFWFFGLLPGMIKSNLFISSLVNIVQFQIWQMKLQKQLIPLGIFLNDFKFSVFKMLKLSGKARESKASVNYWVCRHTFEPP
jgi:hypothetical protein